MNLVIIQLNQDMFAQWYHLASIIHSKAIGVLIFSWYKNESKSVSVLALFGCHIIQWKVVGAMQQWYYLVIIYIIESITIGAMIFRYEMQMNQTQFVYHYYLEFWMLYNWIKTN